MDYVVTLVNQDGEVGMHNCSTMSEVLAWISTASQLRPKVLSITIVNKTV